MQTSDWVQTEDPAGNLLWMHKTDKYLFVVQPALPVGVGLLYHCTALPIMADHEPRRIGTDIGFDVCCQVVDDYLVDGARRDRVRHLLERFLAENDHWVHISEDIGSRGMGLCDSATDELVAFLHDHQTEARALWLTDRTYDLMKPERHYPPGVGAGRNEHCVALIEERLVVDLTARQFDDSLPFPMYWETPRQDLESR